MPPFVSSLLVFAGRLSMLYAGYQYSSQGFGSMIHSSTSRLAARARDTACPVAVRGHAICSRERGFTLVELMITVAVAAILVAIAIPSFKTITLSNRLNASANELVDSINSARMEAIKRNNYAQFCSNSASKNGSDTLGAKCTAAGTGAAVLLEDATSKTTFVAHAAEAKVSTPLKFNGDLKAVRFNGQGIGVEPDGTALGNSVVVDICTDKLSSDNHRLIYVLIGTIVQTKKGSGSCP
jgi:type IV fimbrial biogenesis protein FimT